MSGWSKTFILLSGILYAFVGVYCFFQPIGALIGLAWSIGFLVLTSGIFGVIAYIQIPKEERVIWGTSGVLDGHYFRHVSTYF